MCGAGLLSHCLVADFIPSFTSLLNLQEVLHGFHTPDLPGLCRKPFLSPFVMGETIEKNISICSTSCCHVASCLTLLCAY
jgi:hypothetical protein